MVNERRRKNNEQLRKLIAEYQEGGHYIEAAFVQYCMKFTPSHAMNEDLFEDLRATFFGGATFIFSSIVENAAKSRGHPTREQLDYMSDISDELKGYVNEMLPTVGNA
jgi:hypothetical protein